MIKWAPVWTDDEMLQIVINSNVTALGKLREELNQGSLSVKLPFLEYSTGKPMAKEALPFSKATDLVKVMEGRPVKDIMKEINLMDNFKPFVTLFDGDVHVFGSPCRVLRAEFDYLLKFYKMPEKFKHELAELRNYSDAELDKEFIGRVSSNTAGNPNALSMQMQKYRNVLRNDFPDIEKMINEHIVSTKPAYITKFKGKDYLVYLAGEKKDFHSFYVYFPVEAAPDLPNGTGFPARVIGIMIFNPNPPGKGLSHFAFIAVSLFLQYKSELEVGGSG